MIPAVGYVTAPDGFFNRLFRNELFGANSIAEFLEKDNIAGASFR